MTFEQLEDLKKQIMEETAITPDNAMAMSLKIPNLYMKYLDIYTAEKKKLKKYEQDLDQCFAEKFKHYRFHGDYKVSTKSEADSFVYGDPEYHAKRIRVDGQTVVVDYLHSVVSAISKMGFSINQYLEFVKLKNGIVQ